MCILCDLAAEENAKHMIVQCPYQSERRHAMHTDICKICPDFRKMNVCNIILGRTIDDMDPENMVQIWRISCSHVSNMYWETLRKRAEYEMA